MTHPQTRASDPGAARKAPTLWSVAGGKGGIGRSVVVPSLAIAFAMRGQRCAMIDLDLGAANQHTLLGVAAPCFTLSDFLERKVGKLSEVLCPTPFANLNLPSGARASLDMANPKYSQKEKILRHILGLDFDHVFLDLSVGSAFNALDFFLAAEQGIAVVVLERTSIENTQNFLRTAFFRLLRKAAKHEPIRDAIMQALASDDMRSARDLIRGVAAIDA
jgi:flagellar biosynthesis protein FlhG